MIRRFMRMVVRWQTYWVPLLLLGIMFLVIEGGAFPKIRKGETPPVSKQNKTLSERQFGKMLLTPFYDLLEVPVELGICTLDSSSADSLFIFPGEKRDITTFETVFFGSFPMKDIYQIEWEKLGEGTFSVNKDPRRIEMKISRNSNSEYLEVPYEMLMGLLRESKNSQEES